MSSVPKAHLCQVLLRLLHYNHRSAAPEKHIDTTREKPTEESSDTLRAHDILGSLLSRTTNILCLCLCQVLDHLEWPDCRPCRERCDTRDYKLAESRVEEIGIFASLFDLDEEDCL